MEEKELLTEVERVVKGDLEAEGWEVTKPSWPNFFTVRDGKDGEKEVMFVEVKALGDRLSKKQFSMMVTLCECGFKVEIAKFKTTRLFMVDSYDRLPFGEASDNLLLYEKRKESLSRQREMNEEQMKKMTRSVKQKERKRREEERLERLQESFKQREIYVREPEKKDDKKMESMEEILEGLGKIAERPRKERSPEEMEEIRKWRERAEANKLRTEEEIRVRIENQKKIEETGKVVEGMKEVRQQKMEEVREDMRYKGGWESTFPSPFSSSLFSSLQPSTNFVEEVEVERVDKVEEKKEGT